MKALALAFLLLAAPAYADELKYWEIDGPPTLANGAWSGVIAVNPEASAIRITHIEFVLAIDNTLTADIGVYLCRTTDNSLIGSGSFTLEVPSGAEFALSRPTTFAPHWVTVGAGESLRLVYVGFANNSLVRSYIPVVKIYYYVVS